MEVLSACGGFGENKMKDLSTAGLGCGEEEEGQAQTRKSNACYSENAPGYSCRNLSPASGIIQTYISNYSTAFHHL